jgi:phosphoribosylamine--glycine ligase
VGKRVLVIGQGAREHALTWKLAQSAEIDKLYAAPGNPGIGEWAECVNIEATDIEKLLTFAADNKIDLTVVGPEAPLIEGIVDRFQTAGLRIFGPTAAAARLEGSKVFTKNLLKKYNIPTADYEVFNDVESALSFVHQYTDQGKPVVIKADGLAAGKGVIIAQNFAEAKAAVEVILKEKSFGEAGKQIVVEEYLEGEEVSFFAVSDGVNYVPLLAAQDHKRIFDDDKGPNTGGMGAYCFPPVYTQTIHQQVIEKIIEPVIKAMQNEGHPYQGVLYAGLMITADGPKVLEFNARFGDPETQVLMPMIKSDILPLFEMAAQGKLDNYQVELNEGNCVCVVLASRGYPGSYEKGKIIAGLDNLAADTMVFHAGTAIKDSQLVTSGGRVLSVVCRGQDIEEAISKVYDQIKKVFFEGVQYRKDIGKKALRY